MKIVKTIFTALLGLSIFWEIYAGITDFSPGLTQYVVSRWGKGAEERLYGWRRFVDAQQRLALQNSRVSNNRYASILPAVNTFWSKIPYKSDQDNWGIVDYWATPVEVLGSNGANCVGYAVAKYFTLKELGVPVDKLRITYVRASRSNEPSNEPHMVLAYYPNPDSDPYILDNLTNRIELASDRTDLDPVYSFNDEDLWTTPGDSRPAGKPSQIRLWRRLLEKMYKEQHM